MHWLSFYQCQLDIASSSQVGHHLSCQWYGTKECTTISYSCAWTGHRATLLTNSGGNVARLSFSHKHHLDTVNSCRTPFGLSVAWHWWTDESSLRQIGLKYILVAFSHGVSLTRQCQQKWDTTCYSTLDWLVIPLTIQVGIPP